MQAYVFPGQGIQRKGMGKELFDEFPQLTEQADAILGYSIRKLCLSDPKRSLDATEFTQPAIYTVNALHYEKMRRQGRPRPDFFAGFSLGEYNALCAAGVFDFGTGLQLVKQRGALMGSAKGGGMAAVVGLTEDAVRSVLAAQPDIGVSIANYNTPQQFVLSGRKQDIEALRPVFQNVPGLLMFSVLKTSGAFHSAYMEFALQPFVRALDQATFSRCVVPVISNVTALPYRDEDARRLLAQQICRPVRWTDSIGYLKAMGVTDFHEVGQTGVLAKMIQQIPPAPETVAHATEPAMTSSATAQGQFEPGAAMPPPLLATVLQQCRSSADKVLQIYLHGERIEQATGADLWQRVSRLGSALMRRWKPQAKVLLLLPQSIDYGVALLACWYANVIAIPAPLTEVSQLARKCADIELIARSSGASHMLTDQEFEHALTEHGGIGGLQVLQIGQLSIDAGPHSAPRDSGEEDLALVLYTSGSTSQPKGVKFSHRAIYNSAMSPLWGMSSESRIVSWLPQFHAFGICCGLLTPLVHGALSVVYSPERFVETPLTWFELIHRHQATHTGAPNFAFGLCCDSIRDEDLGGLSMHSLEALICGGDVIHKHAYDEFVRRFAHAGLRADVLAPNYGLSEGGPITLKAVGEPLKSLLLDREALHRKRVRPSVDGATGRVFVSCGRVRAPTRIVVVDAETMEPCAPGTVGEVWIKSPCVMQGYLDDPQATVETFDATIGSTGEGGFLRSGDLGFLDGDELYVIGREKDVIIVNGKNHYPSDIELTIKQEIAACSLPSAVFSMEHNGEERVLVMQEIETVSAGQSLELAQELVRVVSERHRLEVFEVLLVDPKTVPVTGSKKIKRRLSKAMYIEGAFASAWQLSQHRTDSADGSIRGRTYGESVVERRLRDVRERVLLPVLGHRADRLDDADPFSLLGVNSLQSIRLARKVEEVFGVTFKPSMLYAYASCLAIADYIGAQTAAPPAASQRHPWKAFRDPTIAQWLDDCAQGRLTIEEVASMIRERV